MRGLAAAVLLTLAVAVGGCAEDPRIAEEAAKATAAAARPWEPARVTLNTALEAAKTGGVLAIAPLVPDLEQALAQAPEAIAKGRSAPAKVVLVDGPAEMIAAAIAAGVPFRQPGAPQPGPVPEADQPSTPEQASPPSPAVTALESPYPPISLLLGSYYVEIRRLDDAVRVLDAGLALPPAVPGVSRATVPALSSERATALGTAGRWQDALVAWERTLKLPDLSDRDRARMLRGRGVVLIELKRLNEAELTFRDALRLEPGNAAAENELAYIAALRSGRAAVKPEPRRLGTPALR